MVPEIETKEPEKWCRGRDSNPLTIDSNNGTWVQIWVGIV